jgi:hypothetical protein
VKTFYETRASFDEGRQTKEAEDHKEELKKKYSIKWEPANDSPLTAQNWRTNHWQDSH